MRDFARRSCLVHAVIRRRRRCSTRDRLRLRVGNLSLAGDFIPVIDGDGEQVSANTQLPYVMQLFGADPTLSPRSPSRAIPFVHSKMTCLGCYSLKWISALCQVYPAVRQVPFPQELQPGTSERLGYMTTPPMVARGGVHGPSSFV